MDLLRELKYEECLQLLADNVVGRVAFCTPNGPEILPVNYMVDNGTIVFRTSPYAVIGTHGVSGRAAFQIDNFDESTQTGWSVLAAGSTELVEGSFEVARFLANGGPRPWAAGSRPMFIRLRWRDLTGRRVGPPPL
jgi:nitroimidazol reductase NimA-like FMN-containing flavoprotein (pyridoxamine 5'-phosphate oxidase superfamily)